MGRPEQVAKLVEDRPALLVERAGAEMVSVAAGDVAQPGRSQREMKR